MDFSKTLFHCYSLGYIMTEPRGKSNKQKYNEKLEKWRIKQAEYTNTGNKETKTAKNLLEACLKLKKEIDELKPLIDVPNLSVTCKSFLAKMYVEIKYGRIDDIHSKYLEKGLLMEEDALTLYSLYVNEYHEKNKIRVENGWLTGEMDTSFEDWAIDTKVNWSLFQHIKVKTEKINPLYEWQGRGYMWLFAKEKFRLVHALLNTPEHLVKSEEDQLLYSMFGSKVNYDFAPQQQKDVYIEACKQIRKNHNYDDIPLKEKITTFELLRNEDIEEQIKTRITECRQFLQDLDEGKIVNMKLDDEESEAA